MKKVAALILFVSLVCVAAIPEARAASKIVVQNNCTTFVIASVYADTLYSNKTNEQVAWGGQTIEISPTACPRMIIMTSSKSGDFSQNFYPTKCGTVRLHTVFNGIADCVTSMTEE